MRPFVMVEGYIHFSLGFCDAPPTSQKRDVGHPSSYSTLGFCGAPLSSYSTLGFCGGSPTAQRRDVGHPVCHPVLWAGASVGGRRVFRVGRVGRGIGLWWRGLDFSSPGGPRLVSCRGLLRWPG